MDMTHSTENKIDRYPDEMKAKHFRHDPNGDMGATIQRNNTEGSTINKERHHENQQMDEANEHARRTIANTEACP